MKRTNLFILLAVGLAFTLLACSSYPRHRYPYPDSRGGYYGGYERVRNLADDLEEATDRVYDRADDTSHYDSDREDYAMDRLRDLHEEAKDFKNEVDDRNDVRGIQEEYRELSVAYSRARDGMRVLRADGDVYREFDQVSRIMAELNRMYGYSSRDYYGYR